MGAPMCPLHPNQELNFRATVPNLGIALIGKYQSVLSSAVDAANAMQEEENSVIFRVKPDEKTPQLPAICSKILYLVNKPEVYRRDERE